MRWVVTPAGIARVGGTAASPELPADPGDADFEALQEDPARWIGVVAALGARYSSAPAVPAGEGSMLVALLGRELVLKLYPPFLRDHFEFERAMLGQLLADFDNGLPVFNPQL